MSKEFIGVNKFALDTPCLVIDKDKLDYNLKLMQQHADAHQINLRPHCKTHKCSQLAKLQRQYGAIGISAAKISEAEVLINQGITGVLITSPLVSSYKIERLFRCLKKSPDTMIVVDNEENIAELAIAAASINQKINVLLDLDPGIGRTGVKPHLALPLATTIVNSAWLNLLGIQCYAGNLQHIISYQQRQESSLKIMQEASQVLQMLKKAGFPCSILTGTGTGTYDIDSAAAEITEIQPGSYAVMDVDYARIGSQKNPYHFTTFQHAMTLLTTVISANRQEHVTVDAGTKALYFDPMNKPKIISHPHLNYDWGGFGDEHGKITAKNNASLPSNKEILELIVPHCDPTINLFDKFYITQDDIVIDVWDIDARGAAQ